MHAPRLFWVALLAICGLTAAAAEPGTPAPVLLISMDGFRWDYTVRHPEATPHIRALAARGVTARGLIPVFPSNTFPNHYSIVTGQYPSHHGIINNHMFDVNRGQFFLYTSPSASHDSSWWGGEPVWITAVKQGRTSACSFWPGSEAKIGGVHATFWEPYNYSVPFERRLDELIGWLQLPPDRRPAVITFYLEETNSVGHRYGPDSPELASTLKLLDDRIGAIEGRCNAAGLAVNFVLVSDHGMTDCGPDRLIILDDYVDLKTVQVDFDETVGGLRPAKGVPVDTVMQAIARIPHAKAFLARDLPARLHIDPSSPRVPPIWILPDEGWQVLRRSLVTQFKDRFLKGQHGCDPALPSMHGIFIASGPAFKAGVVVPDVENVHIYNLLCAAAGLHPAPNDGDNRLVEAALK